MAMSRARELVLTFANAREANTSRFAARCSLYKK